MLFIVDIQYYTCGGTNVLKEATVLPVAQPLHYTHFVFKPPFPLHRLSTKDMKTVNHVHKRLGNLHWNEGHNTNEEFVSVFTSGTVILCNGSEKTLLLQGLLPQCIVTNINIRFSNLSLSSPSIICPVRNHRQCSLLRSYQLNMYLMKC
jgi:hypothetical protein